MRPPRGGRSVLAAVAAAIALTSCSSAPEPVSIVGPDGSGLFADAGGTWRRALPSDTAVDPCSAEFVRELRTQKPLVSVNGFWVRSPTRRRTGTPCAAPTRRTGSGARPAGDDS